AFRRRGPAAVRSGRLRPDAGQRGPPPARRAPNRDAGRDQRAGGSGPARCARAARDPGGGRGVRNNQGRLSQARRGLTGEAYRMAQDDYYYEIQLTNKQLVFYFMAGATGLILSFLAGVMVGRGVDTGAGDVQASRAVAEERVVAEETPKAAAPPSPADLTYAQRLESEKTDDSLERPKGAAAPAAA